MIDELKVKIKQNKKQKYKAKISLKTNFQNCTNQAGKETKNDKKV